MTQWKSKCCGSLHHYTAVTKWLGLDGEPKVGRFCMHCGNWIIMQTKAGEKGGKVGELLAKQLETLYPAQVIIVHHFANHSTYAQLEVEIRPPDHSTAIFARIIL